MAMNIATPASTRVPIISVEVGSRPIFPSLDIIQGAEEVELGESSGSLLRALLSYNILVLQFLSAVVSKPASKFYGLQKARSYRLS